MPPILILPTENFSTPFHFFKDNGQICDMVSNTSHVQFLSLADLTGRLSCTTPGSSLFSSFLQGVMVFPYCFSAMNNLPPQYDLSVRSQFGHYVLKAVSVFFSFLSSIYNLQWTFGLESSPPLIHFALLIGWGTHVFLPTSNSQSLE